MVYFFALVSLTLLNMFLVEEKCFIFGIFNLSVSHLVKYVFIAISFDLVPACSV